jgi:sugar phosphate isomerase/epimerase
MNTNKALFAIALAVCLNMCFISGRAQAQGAQGEAPIAVHVDHTGLGKLGWQLACQAQTFRDISFFEMIDLLHAQVFHHVELAPGQALSPQQRDVKIDENMAATDVDALNAKLKAVKMDIVSYGVVKFSNDEPGARKVFEFAKKLKAKNIVADPAPDSLEMLDKLATEFSINIAIVNGDKGTPYADCASLLTAIAGRSNHIGACADLGSWQKSGMASMDCIKKLGKKLIELRLSDVDEQGKPVVFAAGAVNPAPILEYLKAQNFKGIFAVEYTQGSGMQVTNNFYQSVNGFCEIVSKLAGTHE